MFREFRDFITRGNIVELAAAVVIGVAFGKIVTTTVEGVIMPPLGLVLGGVDFSSLFVLLDSSKGVPLSLLDAKERGIPVIAYGQLLNDAITFLIVAAAVFLMVKQVNRLKGPPPAPAATKECPFCASAVAMKATRCPHCTSAL